jgi:exopolyphosphatase/guanosine-5'-triphosphate,3'-diphosphate pyrophosphatase
VAGALAAFESRHAIRAGIAEGRVQMLGSSGTVTTLAGVLLALPRYDRAAVDGTFLDFADVRRISRDLLAMDYADRAAQPCIGPDRADLVVAGCAVLEAIITTWPVGRLRIADRGVREGILLELMAEDRRGR